MLDRLSLRAQIIAVVAFLSVALVGVAGTAVGVVGTDRLRGMITHSLEGSAASVANALDRSIFERYREIDTLSRMAHIRRHAADPDGVEQLRAVFDTVQSDEDRYAWIGFADAGGTIRAGTDDRMIGLSAADRPWFQDGSRRPHAGDVAPAPLLESAQEDRASQSLSNGRFVTIAFPVRDNAGDLVGVLAAYLDWDFADEMRRTVLANGATPDDLQIIVVNIAGEVILGVEGVPRETMFTPLMPLWGRGIVEGQGPDGGLYLHGYALASGYDSYPGPGWSVVARRPVDAALAPVQETRAAIIAIAVPVAAAGILGVWFLIGRLVRPLGHITDVAEDLGRDPRSGQMPMVGGSREVSGLSLALRSLLRRIGGLESALDQTQQVMEQQVAEKTRRMADDIAALRTLADYDPMLHRMLNRRAFLEAAGPVLEDVVAGRRDAAAIVFDLDRFKAINDTHGHAAGDAVLQSVAETTLRSTRNADLVARFGGEEFTVLMPNATINDARLLAERLRRAIASEPVAYDGGNLFVTASFGCATIVAADRDVLEALDRADRALYRAKEGGRNTVMAA
ncbi:sensor domain-containing diguanylate cyclase [Fodinicurvata sp. EGI_FJ10296]|uniref:sensor domain-containing diguanylate cyclase n=1 Tax=Fodinicurvata sp. EGI_FJ10296 TaxID=3231908 RepID=UPI003451150C